MTFPTVAETIDTTKADFTVMASDHPGHHDQLARILNSLQTMVLAGGGLATLTDIQTLTQKTLTSPHMTSPVVDSGALTLSAAASQIVPGATSLSFRNNANSADNLLISNAGAVTVRAGLTVTAGNVGIGTAADVRAGLSVGSTALTGTSQWGALVQPVGSSAATGEISGVYAAPYTAAAAFTATTVASFHAAAPGKGAGSSITSAYGLLVDAITSGNTNNYGLYVSAPSGGAGINVGARIDGGLILGSSATPLGTSGQIGLGNTTSGTASAGGSGALPAQVITYWVISISGTNYKIPLYG